MILYHGSYTEISTPKIIVQERGRDFGFGFYTTTVKKQAERWAVRTARLHSRITGKLENWKTQLLTCTSLLKKMQNF